MNFCSECGANVALQSVAGDSRQRFVCTGCGKTHYQNPSVVVAVYDRWLMTKNYGIRIGFIDETTSQYRNYSLRPCY